MVSLSRSTKPPKINAIAASILFGILAGFGLSTIGSFGPPLKSFQQDLPDSVFVVPDDALVASSHSSSPTAEMDVQALQEMVAHTNGFYARDYSLWLGWNNMRYIIETALLHGRILNRTTVVPSFVYARAFTLALRGRLWSTVVMPSVLTSGGNCQSNNKWPGRYPSH